MSNDINQALEAARKMGMDKYIPKLVNAIKATRINPKTGEPYAGVHSTISPLKETLEAVYQKPIAEVADEAVKKGIIEVPEPRKGGYVWYLKGEKPAYDPTKKGNKGTASKKVANALLDSLK